MSSNLLASVSQAVTSISIETIAFIVIIVAISAYSFYAGRAKVMSVLVALLLSGGVYMALEPLAWFAPVAKGTGDVFFFKLLIFLALVFLLSGTLDRVIHGRYSYSKSRRFIEMVILILAFSGTLMAYGFNLLGMGSVYQPSSLALTIFGSATALAGWIIAALVSLFIASRL